MNLRATLVLASAVVLGGCDDDPTPVLPDANIITGTDGNPFDAGSPDAAPDGAPPDSATDGSVDAATDAGRDASEPPDGSTVPPDAGDPCAAAAVAVVSVAEARARETELLGQVITVVGTTTITGRACTQNPCDESPPCCNTCTATVTLAGGLGIAASPCFERPGCRGSECSMVCQPPVLGTEGRYRGVLNSGPVLELLAIEP